MDRELARLILFEQARRDRRPIVDRLDDPRFLQQTKFVNDPSEYVVGICSRRAGKSVGLAKRALKAMHKHPGFMVPYIALTRDSAYTIMWPTLWELNRKYDLGAKLYESDLSMHLRNGSQYKLFGANLKNFIERLRGGKYSEAQVDEGQAFRSHLATLIDDVLGPALADLRGATVLTGTPGPIPSGVFFDASEGKMGYSVHKWTVTENPYFKDPAGYLKKLKEKKGWTDLNPTFIREWLGQWILDVDALVYKFKEEKNLYDTLPTSIRFERILSVDYGWHDQTAFAIIAYSKQSPYVFIEHVEGDSEMVPSAIAAKIRELVDTYRPHCIVADTGGLGKSITEEFIQRYHLAIEPAEKREKLTYITLLNGDFIDGKCFVQKDLTKLRDQYLTLTKAENPTAVKYEEPTLPNDLCDAVLYGYRKAKHFLGVAPIQYKSEREKIEAYARELERKEMEAMAGQQSKPWWLK